MLFMAWAITDREFKLRSRHGWHAIPFGLMVLLNLPVYLLSGPEKLAWVQAFMERVPSYQSFDFYFTLSFFAYIGIYIYFSIRRLALLQQHVRNNVLIRWYQLILIIYSGFLILHLGYFVLQPLLGLGLNVANQLSMLAMSFIIQAIAYKLLDKSALLNAKTPSLADLEARKAHEALILEKLEEEKAFTDEDYSLGRLAESLSLPQPYVAELINERFGCSFKRLISQYRLKEAKRLMNSEEGKGQKLIDIAYQSGFSNKVSFYRTFKELEGMAPSAYQEKQKKEENAQN